jgi:Tfp pilus assembly protein PilV
MIKINKLKFNTNQSGFTLIETLIAILILTLSIGALLSLAAGGFYSVRYARNQIVANNLLQESVEYLRNSRDTSFEQGMSWNDWQLNVLSVDGSGNPTGTGVDGCLGKNLCYIDPYTVDAKIRECPSGGCPHVLYYPDNGFYGYAANYPFSVSTTPFETSFVRSIDVRPSTSNPDQLIVESEISWLNGTTPRSISQQTLITNWRR